jgi:hypothetical protein
LVMPDPGFFTLGLRCGTPAACGDALRGPGGVVQALAGVAGFFGL